jgi:hypothetical protein
MLIKKIFRLAAVLCLFFFSAQMVQAQQLKGQELVDWIKSKTWILFEFTDNEGRTGNYGSTRPIEDLMLTGEKRTFDGCNSCDVTMSFEIINGLIYQELDKFCTRKHCGELYLKPPKRITQPSTADKDTAAKTDTPFVLRMPHIDGMRYERDGEYLILSDKTGKYRLKAM